MTGQETSRPPAADPCTFVVFGASGDLTTRLLVPALYNLAESALLAERFSLVGMARSGDADQLRAKYRQSVSDAEHGEVDEAAFAHVTGGFTFVHGDFDDDAAWARLKEVLDRASVETGSGNCLFYLATAPEHFQNICERLASAGLLDESRGWRRVVIEKPFGTDAASARALNVRLVAVMREEQAYRIDHYLGKETVQNILVFRFGNGIFEPVWNRRYIDHVQITVAESLGVEMRGGYYDQTGALRDMVPNHLFQLLTLTAMEPPSALDAQSLHNEHIKVLAAIEPLVPDDCGLTTVRGQYQAGTIGETAVDAYRREPRVDPASHTETFVAFKIAVDNWRWAGVPFYLRTGKRLRRKKTEVVIQFRQPPLALFRASAMSPPEPNQLVISIQPEESIRLRFAAKVPGPEVTTSPVDMRFNYGEYFGAERQTGYETLLYDVMTGDRSLFKRGDIVEAGWSVVDAILQGWGRDGSSLVGYPAGSQGPAAADELLSRDGRAWKAL